MLSYSPFERYRCCQHNHGIGWPYYAEELWLGTSDGGLCASLYAASSVTAKVGAGAAAAQVTIQEETEYPFRDTILLKITAPAAGAAFPLYLRVPGWCDGPQVAVNGSMLSPMDPPKPGSYVAIRGRTWKAGDTVMVKLPMKVALKKWERNQDSISVNRGPLTYSLAIGERTQNYGKKDPAWPQTEIFAATPWNYGLDLASLGTDVTKAFEVVEKPGPVVDQPFTLETAPVSIKAKARRIDAWKMDNKGLLNVLQPSPARTSEPVETVSLVPMGAARLRITAFPTASDTSKAHEWNPQPPPPAKSQGNYRTTVSVSNVANPPTALSDGMVGGNSADKSVPRFTWQDHRGTAEWAQYDFDGLRRISGVQVYWVEDPAAHCRVPASWRLLYRKGEKWQPVDTEPQTYNTARDGFIPVTFKPIDTAAVRLEVQLQPGESAGLLEWKIE